MEHPITPPPELVQQWIAESASEHHPTVSYSLVGLLATAAARWGADQELEACCEWTRQDSSPEDAASLRAARRPKLPSKAESALNALEHILRHSQTDHGANTIRLALEQLKKLEALDD